MFNYLQVFESNNQGVIDAVLPSQLEATSLKIVPESGNEDSDTMSISDLSVYACYTEESTTVTTTTTGAVTTEKTTTKVTSAGTTVTTVISTTTPAATTGTKCLQPHCFTLSAFSVE